MNSKPIISWQIRIGDYIINYYDEDSLWLEHRSGEGMQVWHNDFNELIDKFYKENF